MDGHRDCHTEWSKLEKHILMHICGIWKNWYSRSYLQSRNRDIDVKNQSMDNQRERGIGWIARLGLTYVHY